MHSSWAVANYFIVKSGYDVDLVKLMGLVYMAQGMALGTKGAKHPLTSEFCQAWQHGPVFPNVFHEFRLHPPGNIKALAKRIVYSEKGEELQTVVSNFSRGELIILNAVSDIFKDSREVPNHLLKNGAWENAWKKYEGDRGFEGIPIFNGEIAHYFKHKIIDKYRIITP